MSCDDTISLEVQEFMTLLLALSGTKIQTIKQAWCCYIFLVVIMCLYSLQVHVFGESSKG